LDALLAGVDGWLDVREAQALYAAARRRGATHAAPVTVVEIGSYLGRSTIALGLGVRDAGGGRVLAVDPHPYVDDRFAEFRQNIRRAELDEIVEPVRLTSHDARPGFDGPPVDVLFVDGMHTYDAVREDIEDWTTTLADGAVVAFNDPFLDGVSQALIEQVAAKGSPFRAPSWVINTVMVEYAPGASDTARDRRDRRRLRAFLAIGRSEDRLRRWIRDRGANRGLGVVRRVTLGALRAVLPPASTAVDA
jgi:predicted O-methyltransferase YrrM